MEVEKTPYWSIKSARFFMTLVLGSAILAHGFMRITLNMAMVCMVSPTFVNDTSSEMSSATESNSSSSCMSQDDYQNEYQGTFNWGNYEQGLLFSAIYIGGFISTLPAGWLSDRYNPKLIVAVGTICTTITCLLSPIAALKFNFIGLFVLRFILGIFSAALISPATSSILARWIPPMERSTAVGVYSAGSQLSLIIGMLLNAFLCQADFLGGWPAIFYVNGIFGAIASILWIALASNRAETSKFISEKEKKYIVCCLAQQNLGVRKEVTKKIPWKQMLLSPALLSCLFASFSTYFAMVTIQIYVPTYYKEALHLDLSRNGLYAALPNLTQFISKILFAVIGDLVKKKTKFSHTWICKFFNTLACLPAAGFLIACSYVTCSEAGWAVTWLSLANFMISAIIPGYATSMLSIAPAYSGIVASLCSFIGQIAAVLAPLMVSALTPHGTVSEWRNVFFLIALLLLIQCVLFLIFGSSSIQDWAKLPAISIKTKESLTGPNPVMATDVKINLVLSKDSKEEAVVLKF